MELWCPFAVKWLAPTWKQGYAGISNRFGAGAVVHSMEGGLQGALARLESSDTVSWHFSVPYTGGVLQHLPLPAVAWHAGAYANKRWAGIECEGRAGEPLTKAQLQGLEDVLWWMATEEQWPGFLLKKDVGTLHEHNWYMATACPSSRIPWETIIRDLVDDEPSNEALLLDLLKRRECAMLSLDGKYEAVIVRAMQE